MKGTIVCCLRDMVNEKFGSDVWVKSMTDSGLEADTTFLAMDDVPDEKVMEVIGNLCKQLKITIDQAGDAFGEYWSVVYAPRVYRGFYLGVKNSKELLMRMNSVHDITTKTTANANPPKFLFEELPSGNLVITYQSRRNLMPVFLGLVRGVGKYFKEELKLNVIGSNKVEVSFPA